MASLARPRNGDCVVCGDHPTVTDLIDDEDFCGISAPATNVPPRSSAPPAEYAVDVAEARRLNFRDATGNHCTPNDCYGQPALLP